MWFDFVRLHRDILEEICLESQLKLSICLLAVRNAPYLAILCPDLGVYLLPSVVCMNKRILSALLNINLA